MRKVVVNARRNKSIHNSLSRWNISHLWFLSFLKTLQQCSINLSTRKLTIHNFLLKIIFSPKSMMHRFRENIFIFYGNTYNHFNKFYRKPDMNNFQGGSGKRFPISQTERRPRCVSTIMSRNSSVGCSIFQRNLNPLRRFIDYFTYGAGKFGTVVVSLRFSRNKIIAADHVSIN